VPIFPLPDVSRRFDNAITMQRPAGVTLIAVLFFLAAVYLCVIGSVMLIAPGAISLRSGAPLMFGLELAGPYMAFLIGAAWGLVGWGLLRQSKWARWAAIAAAAAGIGLMVPSVSQAAINLNWPVLLSGGVQVAIRTAALWYLTQVRVAETFLKNKAAT
jgi:hypothetical protein